MTLVFGSSTATFNSQATGQGNGEQFTAQINHLVLYFVYLFVARFVIGYVATLCICIAATRTTRAMRKAFLESLLRQEVWHFDKEDNGSPATQVTMSRFSCTIEISSLTETPRRQPRQSRNCREAVHTRPRHLAILFGIHCSTRRPVEACSHYHEYSTSHISYDRSNPQLRCTYRSPNCK